MIVIGAALLGAIIGVLTARRRGGKPLDLAQYAAAHAIAFAIIGLIVTVIIERMAG